MKKYAIFLLISFLILSLCSCGPEESPHAPADVTDPVGAEEPAVSDGDVYISDWYYVNLPEAMDFTAQYIRTNGYNDGEEYPKTLWITSREELDDYYAANSERYFLGHVDEVYSDTGIGFADAAEKYDDDFFVSHNLILVVLEEPSGSIRHEVTGVARYPSMLDIVQYFVRPSITRTVPEVGTADMAEWHVIIEVGKDISPETCKLMGASVETVQQ